jgi:hypothetical protein
VSPLEPDRSPQQIRRGQIVRWAVVIGAVAQLVVAVVLALGQGADPSQQGQLTVVAPAGSVTGEPTTTTAPPVPVVVEIPTATTAPAPPPTVALGAVFGVIGAGPGGRARADLRDEGGNTWHSEADSHGGYRFDRLPPGRYQLILSAESPPEPCPPGGPCTGTAMAISKRIIEIGPGQTVREDYPVYGPTGPSLPTTTTTAAPSVPLPSTTTTSTTAKR